MRFFESKQTQRTNNFVLAAMLVISTLTASVPFLFSQKADALAQSTIVSTQAAQNGWVTEDGAPAYVAGPTGATGNGSLKFQAATSTSKNNYFHSAPSTPLSDVSGLGYSVYDTAGIPASYQLKVLGVNRTDGKTNGYTTLVWEPVYNNQTNGPTSGFVNNTDLRAGVWWSTSGIPGAPNRSTFVSLDTIIEANSEAYVVGYGANVGSGTPGAVSYVDNISFGNTVTNFEVTPPATPTGLRFGEFACGGSTNINSITPTWDAVSGAASYNYRVTTPNGSVYGPKSLGNVTSVNGPFGGEGYSTFEVQAVDSEGLTSSWASPCGVTYDATVPAVPTNGLPNKTVLNTNDFYFTWSNSSGNGTAVTYEFQSANSSAVDEQGSLIESWNSTVNGNPEQKNLTSPAIHSTGAADGNYYWQVRALDAAGNKSAWSTVWSVTLDTSKPPAPVVTATDLFSGATTAAESVNVLWTMPSTDTVKYDYRVWTNIESSNYKSEGTAYQEYDLTGTSRIGAFSEGEGSYYIQVRAKDAAGNPSSWSNTFVVSYDKTNPTVSLASSYTVPGDTTKITINAIVTDASQYSYVLTRNGTSVQSGALGEEYIAKSFDQSGPDNFVLTVTDAAGNESSRSLTVPFVTNQNGGTTTTTTTQPFAPEQATIPSQALATAVTPTITSPAAAAVLGATTDNATTLNSSGAADVAGASTEKIAAAVNSDANKGTIFGLAWYWWILILAAIAGIAWFITAAIRRRNENQA